MSYMISYERFASILIDGYTDNSEQRNRTINNCNMATSLGVILLWNSKRIGRIGSPSPVGSRSKQRMKPVLVLGRDSVLDGVDRSGDRYCKYGV